MQETWLWSWSWRIPPAVEQLSPCATTSEPVLQSPEPQPRKPTGPRACALQQEKPPQWEAHTSQRERSPRGNDDPAQPKINKHNYCKYIFIYLSYNGLIYNTILVVARMWPGLWELVLDLKQPTLPPSHGKRHRQARRCMRLVKQYEPMVGIQGRSLTSGLWNSTDTFFSSHLFCFLGSFHWLFLKKPSFPGL